MSTESNATNDKIAKFSKNVSELTEALSDQSLVPEQIQMTLKELDDGFSGSVAKLSEIFTESARRKGVSLYRAFQDLPVTYTIENYPYPVILLSDEQELDAETCKIVRNRFENGYKTFPVILLSDQFFRLAFGENFSYGDIIKVFEEAANEKVMVFRRSEFRFLKEYVAYIQYLFLIYKYREVIDNARTFLSEEAENSEQMIEKPDAIAGLLAVSRIKAILQLDTELERLDKKFENQIIEWEAEIADIREKCDRAVLEEISHVKADKISPFVLNIDLKYGKLQSYIKDFLLLCKADTDYDFLQQEMRQLVAETYDAVSTNKAKLSLIGTFSSGKTTLINTFLGEREIPLRTSMGHNTAVLMHLFHEQSPEEYYDIIYKDKLTWTVVKPASMDRPVINKENDSIRIQSIEQGSNGNYIVRYSLVRSREQRAVRIRARNGIAVKKGDVLQPGAPFSLTGKQISTMVEICSKSEIQLLIRYVNTAKEFKLTNAEESNSNKNAILNLLARIEKIAGEKNSTKTYDQFCQAIGLNPMTSGVSVVTGRQSYPTKYRRIEVECKLGLQTVRKKLDHKGWLELCGDPNQDAKQAMSIFSEQPECYMLAKELQLHINTEFLQYCSLTDTPGFGSVTEEHDAITERYIRDSSGRLLVMIAINAKTIDAKYQDLINSIDDIYNNFRKNDKKNVVFILNCFTNLTAESNIRNQVENVYRMLVGYGFNRNNIFVCNLKNALFDKQQMDIMFGHPSYKRFHDFIINEMISTDLTAKYRGIKANWTRFFTDSRNRLNAQIHELESNLHDLHRYQQQLRDIISRLNGIEIDEYHFDSDAIMPEFQTMYDNVISAYRNNRKGVFENVRWNAILRELDTVKSTLDLCNQDIIETIMDYYTNCLRRISYCGDSQISMPYLNYPSGAIAVLEFEQLKSLLSTADDETHWYNKSSKDDYYSEKILALIQEGYDQTFDKAAELCDRCYEITVNYRSAIIREKQSVLNSLKDEQTIKHRLRILKTIQKNLLDMERRFARIVFV